MDMTTESQLAQEERDALEDERRIALYPDEPELHDIIRKAKYDDEAPPGNGHVSNIKRDENERLWTFEEILREELELFPDEADEIQALLAELASDAAS